MNTLIQISRKNAFLIFFLLCGCSSLPPELPPDAPSGRYSGVIFAEGGRVDSVSVLLAGERATGRWSTRWYKNPASNMSTTWDLLWVGDECEARAMVGVNVYTFSCTANEIGLLVRWHTLPDTSFTVRRVS